MSVPARTGPHPALQATFPSGGRLGVPADAEMPCPCLPELDLIRLASSAPSPAGKADSYPSQERDVLLRTRLRAGTGRDENLASPVGEAGERSETDEVLLRLPHPSEAATENG